MYRNGLQQDRSFEDLGALVRAIILINSPLRQRLHDVNIQGDKKRLNLLLLGKTGHGKSSTGNSTLGRKAFKSSASATSVTSEVTCSQSEYKNYEINVIDSPGLADTNYSDNKLEDIEKAVENMETALTKCRGSIHAFLFVIKFGNRFTQEEKDTLHYLRQIFGSNFFRNYGILVFTHGEHFKMAMEDEDTPTKTFGEWCRDQTGNLQDVMMECNFRCVLFSNRAKNEHQQKKQLEQLIELAENIREVNSDMFYSRADFWRSQNSREKLILECKVPQLKKDYQGKINSLNSDINRVCGWGNTNSLSLNEMRNRVHNLRREIENEDKNTGLLRDLIQQTGSSLSQIDVYQQRQATVRQINEASNSDSGCCIL